MQITPSTMKSLVFFFILTFITLLVFDVEADMSSDSITNFYACVNKTTRSQIRFNQGFYDPNFDNKTFTSILNSTALNLRCLSPTLQKANAIFTPSNFKEVQAAVQCAPLNCLNLRVRCGGHDYEGLSYITYTGESLVTVDLRNFRKAEVDIRTRTAWVDTGMTIGEMYYWISQKSKTLAFPAGIYTDLGLGGHLTGGGYGSIMRKFGLAVDNAVDALIVNASGQILDRKSMGEDLFWAIRGAGGNNLCIILRWKIQLVPIPEVVTVFSVLRTVNPRKKETLKTLQKWQLAAPNIANELFIRAILMNGGSNNVLTMYQATYLGRASDLLRVMKKSFPELGLAKTDCHEMSWIESVIVNSGFNPLIKPIQLLNGKGAFLNYFKSKSDYFVKTISVDGLSMMLRIITEGGTVPFVVFTPYGGKVSEIAENATAFPHRKVLFKIQYVANWKNSTAEAQLEHEAWVRKLYNAMTPFATTNPRQNYVNYRDLDIGKSDPNINCSDPNLWGPKYYKNENYQRLVKVKSKVDPLNIFNNEQSIPTSDIAKDCIPFDTVSQT